MEVRIYILNALRQKKLANGNLTLKANSTELIGGTQEGGNSIRSVQPSWIRSLPAAVVARGDFGSGLKDGDYVASVNIPGNARVKFAYLAHTGIRSNPTIEFDVQGRDDTSGRRGNNAPIHFKAQSSTNKITARYTLTTDETSGTSGSPTATIATVIVLIGEKLPYSENAVVNFWNQTGTDLTLIRTKSNTPNVYGTAAPQDLSSELGSPSQGRGVMLLPTPGVSITYEYILSGINAKYTLVVSCDTDGKIGLTTNLAGASNNSGTFTTLVLDNTIRQYNTIEFDVYFIGAKGAILPGTDHSDSSSADEQLEIKKIKDKTEKEEEEEEVESPDGVESSDVPYEVTLDIINALPGGDLVLQKDRTIAPNDIRFDQDKPVLEKIGKRTVMTVTRGPGGMNDLLSGQIGFTMPAIGVLVLRYEVSGDNVAHGEGTVIALSLGREPQLRKRFFTANSSDVHSVWIFFRESHQFPTGLPQLDALRGDGPDQHRIAICVGLTPDAATPSNFRVVPMGLNFVNRSDMVLVCTKAVVTRGDFPGTGVPDVLRERDNLLSLGKSIYFPRTDSRLELEYSASASSTKYKIEIDIDADAITIVDTTSYSETYGIGSYQISMDEGTEITIWFAGRDETVPTSVPDRSDGEDGDSDD